MRGLVLALCCLAGMICFLLPQLMGFAEQSGPIDEVARLTREALAIPVVDRPCELGGFRLGMTIEQVKEKLPKLRAREDGYEFQQTADSELNGEKGRYGFAFDDHTRKMVSMYFEIRRMDRLVDTKLISDFVKRYSGIYECYGKERTLCSKELDKIIYTYDYTDFPKDQLSLTAVSFVEDHSEDKN